MKRLAQISILATVFALSAHAVFAADDSSSAVGAAAPVGMPGLPQLPALGDPSAMPAAPMLPVLTDTGATTGEVPGLPALSGNLSDSTAGTTSAAGVANQLSAFLFRDDETLGKVNRERMDLQDAEKVRAAEIEKYKEKYRQGNQPGGQAGYPGAYGGGGAYPGQDAYQAQQREAQVTAGAEFDLYYQQLALYDRYMRETLLKAVPEEEMPDEPTYEAANYREEAVTLQKEFEKAAIALVNKQQEENAEFIDRLEQREDRRQAFYQWVDSIRQDLDEWTARWARSINGQRWIGGDTRVHLNDWYAGVNIASPMPVNLTVDGQKFLVSRKPQKDVPEDTLNILTTNLTPFDLVDTDGNVKDVITERMRGTAVRAPQAPSQTGTIVISD